MELNKDEIYKRINLRNFSIKKDDLIEKIKNTFLITRKLTLNYDFKKLEDSEKHNMNPMLWEFGHFLSFWENLIIKNLIGTSNKLKNYKYIFNSEYYDSFKLSKKNRYHYYDDLINIRELKEKMYHLENLIIEHINLNFNKVNSYLIYLGLLHQHMHNESFIFSLNQIDFNSINFTNNYDYNEIIENIKFINIKGGEYNQGSDYNSEYFYFDNEFPMFKVIIEDFTVSENPITNYQFIKFIENDGYNKKELFSPEAWKFIKDHNLTMPYNFIYEDGKYYEKVFGKKIKLRYNHPVCVTWYEANAFCKMFNYKLIKESEWEYLADNNNGIFDYELPVSITKDKNINRFGVKGLFGNYWEWCEESIYPYDGFIIDPVYREMSYPFFGFKKICRGGAWCVPNFLATRTYRNAQLPDCYYQFITFRIKL